MLSGAHLPNNVEIKKYYSPKEPSAAYGSFNKEILELEALGNAGLRGSDVLVNSTVSVSNTQANDAGGRDNQQSTVTEDMVTDVTPASIQDQPTSNNIQGDESRTVTS